MEPPALANHVMICKNVQSGQEQNYHLSLYVGKVWRWSDWQNMWLAVFKLCRCWLDGSTRLTLVL